MKRILLTPLIVLSAAVVLVVVVYFCAYTFSKPRQYVNLGTPVRQDDFTYTVTALRKASQIGTVGHLFRARGTFYIITVRLDNHAVRVPFEWDDRIVTIVDAGGQRYAMDPPSQNALIATNPGTRTIPAGGSASFQVIFDLPRNIERPAVVFENGIMMGDAFNFVAYRRIAVALN